MAVPPVPAPKKSPGKREKARKAAAATTGGVMTVASGLWSLVFYSFAAAFLFLRLGEWILLLRMPEVPPVLGVVIMGNVLLSRVLGIPLPSTKLQLMVFMGAVVYYFDAHTAARSHPVVDLAGKVAVVTGGNSGIGLATATALAARNATVVIGCRSEDKCAAAAEDIRKSASGTGEVVPMPLDLADLGAVQAFAKGLSRRFPRVDILVNNAGLYPLPWASDKPTPQGIEYSFGVMHLGHFALTEWLIRANERGAEDLVVVAVASGMHHICQLYTALKGITLGGWEDACLSEDFIEAEFADSGTDGYRPYRHWPILREQMDMRYYRAKLANVLHAMELPERHPGVFASAPSLGFVTSNISPMHRFLGRSIPPVPLSPDRLFYRQATPHGIRPVLIGAVLPFARQWAREQGIDPTRNGALIDALGDVLAPFVLEKAIGLGSIGGQASLAAKLYDTSASILASFEAGEKVGSAASAAED